MRILIANAALSGRTGAELAVLDLGAGLAARGHDVVAYAPELGPVAEQLSAAGVRVVSRLDDLDRPPDIVHGHHFVETVEALNRFPGTRGVFVCRDRGALSIPPQSNRIHRFIGIDLDTIEYLRDDWNVAPSRIRTIETAVDMRRFLPRSPLPARPTRALVFSNHAAPGTHDVAVREACERAGVAVEVMGSGANKQSDRPEAELGKFDLVFAKARCAIEAIATGTAVVLCDAAGSGPMVTSADLPRLRAWNFGTRLLTDPLRADTLAREIARYDSADAAAVSRSLRETASLDAALDRYEALYAEVMAEPAGTDASLRTLTEPLLTRTNRLQRELAKYRQPERMQPLADEDLARVHLSAEPVQHGMLAGAADFVRIRVQNDLDAPIGTWPPFPVHFGYRWRRMESPQFLQLESLRTLLHRPASPGARDLHFVRVVAPASPGRYVLRITLVQEGWRWFDEGPMPVFVDVDMMVTKPTLLTSLGR